MSIVPSDKEGEEVDKVSKLLTFKTTTTSLKSQQQQQVIRDVDLYSMTVPFFSKSFMAAVRFARDASHPEDC